MRDSLFVAVVTQTDPTKSGREQGDLSCFVGTDRDVIVAKAMAAALRWSGVHHCDGPDQPAKFMNYRVLVGELASEARYMVALEELRNG